MFFWEYQVFLGSEDDGPARIIPLSSILSQACRLTINKTDRRGTRGYDSDSDLLPPASQDISSFKLWATVGLTLVDFYP